MLQKFSPLIIPTLIFSFWAFTFLESALSKLFDLPGNLAYFKGQFSKSFLKSITPLAFYGILCLELVSGISALTCLILLFTNLELFVKIGILSLAFISLNVFLLYAGQRIAKDYAGASGIVGYVIVCLFGLMAIFGR